MKKQVLFFLLMLMPLMASASTKINGIYYNLNSTDKVAEVTSVPSGTTKYSGNIVIPKTVSYGSKTYSVTSIRGAFWFCTDLTSVTIPSSVTSIDNNSFGGCPCLSSIIVENGNTVYDSRNNCNAIVKTSTNELITGCKSTIIPSGVTSIDANAFYYCTGLTSVTIPNSVITIGYGAFSRCSDLTSISIPNSVISIGDCAFEGCSNLSSITLPSSVTYISYRAFYGCSGLTSITIPSGVKSIGYEAFTGCSGLTSVNIPNSVTTIEELAFYGCSNLKSVNISDVAAWCKISFSFEYGNPLYYARHLFLNGTEVRDLVIPNSVTSIRSYAFNGCSGLSSIIIPNSVTSIGNCAFSRCSGLTSLTIPNSVTSIGDYAFSGCSTLTSLTIPNSVTSIGVYAFSGCSSLTSVTISNNVTSIGGYAFENCSGLTSVTIPNSVTSIESSAFSGCTSLPILNKCRYADTYLVEVVDKTIASCAIREGTRLINNSAFTGCSLLTSITIPNSVTSIGDYTFQGCGVLSSISIGKGIKSVGTKAFANCPEIKEVYCYAKEVPTISNDTFENSYYVKFATLYVPEASVDLYKASAWSQFGNIVGITGGNEEERCAKPVITLLANGKIKVESATEGASCVTNITASNAEPLSNGEISLNTPLIVYTVTSYATKEGYDDSEVATAMFRYEKAEGDMNGDGMLNITDVIHLVNMILGQ